jgi:hypothetical protein
MDVAMPIAVIIAMSVKSPMGSTSKLRLASSTTTSIVTVVPSGIIEQTGWKDGDTIEWTIEFLQGKKAVVVQKKEA